VTVLAALSTAQRTALFCLCLDVTSSGAAFAHLVCRRTRCRFIFSTMDWGAKHVSSRWPCIWRSHVGARATSRNSSFVKASFHGPSKRTRCLPAGSRWGQTVRQALSVCCRPSKPCYLTTPETGEEKDQESEPLLYISCKQLGQRTFNFEQTKFSQQRRLENFEHVHVWIAWRRYSSRKTKGPH
jgi:hypothetical protein